MTACSNRKISNPYAPFDGTPTLLPSYVCYADILGYSEAIKQAFQTGSGQSLLDRLRKTLSHAYTAVRLASERRGQSSLSFYSTKIFTDNIVIGYPVKDLRINLGLTELMHIFSVFSEYQVKLAMAGFFIRGGIAFGSHYMDDDIVYGDALLEAHELNKSGTPPRLALAPSVIQVYKHQSSKFGNFIESPQYDDLLEDNDGIIFLNYLSHAFIAFPEAGISFDIIEGHQQAVIEGLHIYRDSPSIQSKYLWAARYHNFVCNELIRRYPLICGDDISEESICVGEEVRKLSNYLININDGTSPPHRIITST